MKWLTKKQVEKAGHRSHLAACECALKHWLQAKAAGAKELRKAYKRDKVGFGSEYCALCHRHIECRNCLLKPKGGDGCCREYQEANTAIKKWYKRDGVTYRDVQKAITPLTNRLRKAVIAARKRA